MTDQAGAFLRVENLKKYFPIRKGIFRKTVNYVRAVDDVSFTIQKGETLGLVGESGCGKSTTGRTLMHLLTPTAGSVYFQGREIGEMLRENPGQVRQNIQIIFQDPYGSLNPRMTVGEIVGEAVKLYGIAKGARELDRYVTDVIVKAGLLPEHRFRHPHEFSGGQRQRIGIARALALNPKFIVCDEPVSALDVSIQSQVLNELRDLQQAMGLTYLFITHDLSVVKHISDRIAIMYLGKIVEITSKSAMFSDPLHPYTKALMSAIPLPDPAVKVKRVRLEGDIPSPIDPPPGCRFHTRCPHAMERCSLEEPPLREAEPGHRVACFLV